jgi:Icc-related predicted phosphoesterase
MRRIFDLASLSSTKSKPTLVALSDTHELHREVDLPDADIFVHAGDFTQFSLFSQNSRAIADFDRWLEELPYQHKIVVPGDHENFLERSGAPKGMLRNARLLINEAVEIDGLRIWGSPVTASGDGAFGVSAREGRRHVYDLIPENTDVLITHGPPSGILDCSPGSSLHLGCPELLNAVMRVRPRLHVFGHVHAGYGTVSNEFTLFVNASLMGPYAALDKRPMLFEMKRS